jgi:hypothetical protein
MRGTGSAPSVSVVLLSKSNHKRFLYLNAEIEALLAQLPGVRPVLCENGSVMLIYDSEVTTSEHVTAALNSLERLKLSPTPQFYTVALLHMVRTGEGSPSSPLQPSFLSTNWSFSPLLQRRSCLLLLALLLAPFPH